MIFKDGNSYSKGTKLTGIITSLGERYVLNDGVWCHADDLKFAWGYIEVGSATATFLFGEGVYSVTREGDGIVTVQYTSTFDAVPSVVAQGIATGTTAASMMRVTLDDGVAYERSTTKQTFRLHDWDGTLTNGAIFFLAVGADAETTLITDNSAQTPLTANMLNRILAVGNYKNPSTIDDTVFVLSAGYTSTNADIGDTLNDISNFGGAQTRTAAGDMNSAFTNSYLVRPVSMATAISTTSKHCVCLPTINGVDVNITSGADDTEVDSNYCIITIGEMAIS